MVAIAIGVGAIGSVVSGSIASSGAQKAASTEAAATNAATAAEQADFQQAYGLEQPYAASGTAAEAEIQAEMQGTAGVPGQTGWLGAMPSLTDPTALPGYSFTLDQGEKATANAASAQGLGISGVALKGAASYAENLASTYYNNYISNYWTNQNNRFNMLSSLVNTGATAAGTLGGQAVNTGANVANTTQAGANSVAAAQEASSNAQASGVQGISSGLNNALFANALLGNSTSTSTIGPTDSQLKAGVAAMFPGYSNP